MCIFKERRRFALKNWSLTLLPLIKENEDLWVGVVHKQMQWTCSIIFLLSVLRAVPISYLDPTRF